MDRVRVDADGVSLESCGHRVRAANVVMCTNGYVDHVIEDADGDPIGLAVDQRVQPTVGFMAGYVDDQPAPPVMMSFIRNQRIGETTSPYAYITRRTYEGPNGVVSLTCLGGPEMSLDSDLDYSLGVPYPAAALDEIDDDIRPLIDASRGRGSYQFVWNGVMGIRPHECASSVGTRGIPH